jgi:hypothetical protein
MQLVLSGIFAPPLAASTPAATVPEEVEEPPADGVAHALYEAEAAASTVLDSARAIELAPQTSYIRRLQHQVAERSNLLSRSRGKEPHRHVEILPGGRH